MIQNVNVIYLVLLPMDHSALHCLKQKQTMIKIYIKCLCVDSDYMTLLYTYLAIYIIYNCAKKNIEML